MEIKFGISGMLKPQKEKKEKNSNKSSTLKRKWSLKFPKLDKRDNSGSSNVIGTRNSTSDAGADKSFNNSNNNKPDYRQKVEKETSYSKNPPPHPHRSAKHQTRAWVEKKEAVVEADLDDIQALEQLNYEARTLLDDVRLDERSQITSGQADRFLDFQELYQVISLFCPDKNEGCNFQYHLDAIDRKYRDGSGDLSNTVFSQYCWRRQILLCRKRAL